MSESLFLKIIGHVECDLDEKFGAPRQSGLCPALSGRIVFEKEFAVSEAFREIEGYSHLWILWWFHQFQIHDFSPTVRPPRLGGNTRVGVFASRSPNRPNPIGLSCVKLEQVEWNNPRGTILHVSGIDMIDKTPVLDVKPYIPYSDIRQDAVGGFSSGEEKISAEISPECKGLLSEKQETGLLELLRQDPRPGYQRKEMREYGITYAGYNVQFHVQGGTAVVYAINAITEDHPNT